MIHGPRSHVHLRILAPPGVDTPWYMALYSACTKEIQMANKIEMADCPSCGGFGDHGGTRTRESE
jgi:hypothetical protein